MIKNNKLASVSAILAALAISACSSVPQTQAEKADLRAANDPIESVNRVVFDVNDFLDRLLIRPLAELYRAMIPPPLRDRVSGIVKNMSEPVIMANNMMQGDFTKAGKTFARFMTNTTLGGAGMFEVANHFNLPRQTGDFGQTLYSWGVGEGAYIVLPLLGPSNIRDAVGMGVDSVMSPWQYLAAMGSTMTKDTFTISSTVASGITRREENIEGMDALREGSLDFYAQMRSVYRQYRAKQLGASLASEVPKFEEYDN